ncbi:UNVERIFIED_CONTAM: hypothetical protein FKN15_050733 [Acipenser sinensis]
MFNLYPKDQPASSSGDSLGSVSAHRNDAKSGCNVSDYSTGDENKSNGKNSSGQLSKFCHECGTKYPVELAKFCY